MSRSRIIFLMIIGSAVLFVLIVQVSQRLPSAPTPTPLPPLSIEIAVSPLAYEWVNEQATLYNAQNPRIDGRGVQFRVTSRDGIDIWQAAGVWTATNHPAAWIPEGTFARDYAAEIGINYTVITPTVANTPLVWGVFSSRVPAIADPVDWASLQAAAAAESWQALGGNSAWGFVKPAFPLPQRNTVGYAVILSGAAAFHGNAALNGQLVGARDFQLWFEAVARAVPNFSTLGANIAAVLASRGVSTADYALLPESEWLNYFAQINAREPIQFVYPAQKFTFNFPVAVWSTADNTERRAVEQFAEFLLRDEAQRAAAARGLRPANGSVPQNATLFSAARSAGITSDAVPGTEIAPPDRTSALATLNWFRSVRAS